MRKVFVVDVVDAVQVLPLLSHYRIPPQVAQQSLRLNWLGLRRVVLLPGANEDPDVTRSEEVDERF